MRLAAVVLLSQATLDAAFGALLSPLAAIGRARGSPRPRRAIRAGPASGRPMSARLAALPPGLVAGDIDLGPYIVALSPHRVVAAPYHRLEKGILANHAIMHGTPEQALPQLRALGVDYVALCADRPDRPATGGAARTSLRARLLGDERPQFLRRDWSCRKAGHTGLEDRARAVSRSSSACAMGLECQIGTRARRSS